MKEIKTDFPDFAKETTYNDVCQSFTMFCINRPKDIDLQVEAGKNVLTIMTNYIERLEREQIN